MNKLILIYHETEVDDDNFPIMEHHLQLLLSDFADN